MGNMVSIGIDPGTINTGIAVVRWPDALLYSGVIHPYEGIPWKRVQVIAAKVADVCATYRPDVVGIERFVYRRHDPNNNLETLNWLIGALVAAIPQGTPITLYTVSQWRTLLIGDYCGSRDKGGAKDIVEMRLKKRFTTRGLHDMDAAGIALTALDAHQMQARQHA